MNVMGFVNFISFHIIGHDMSNQPERMSVSIKLILNLLILSILVIASRVPTWERVEYPGHADRSYYYTVAYNLYHGKGFYIDYIWEFLTGRTSVSGPSNAEHWMPLPSVMMFLALQFMGDDTPKTAVLASVVFAALLALLSYLYTYYLYQKSHLLAWATALIVAFSPPIFNNSVILDSPIYYTVFVLAAFGLFNLMQRSDHPLLALFTGIAIGLAHLSRSDGLLIFTTIIILIFVNGLKKDRFYAASLVTIGYGGILGSWLVRNWRVLGYLQPRGLMSHIALTTGRADGLYSYNTEATLSDYLAQGLTNILEQKQLTILWILNHRLLNLLGYITPLLCFFILLQLVQWKGSLAERWAALKRNPFTGPVLFGATLFLLHGLVFSSVGRASFGRSVVALVPFAALAGVTGMAIFINHKHHILILVTGLLLLAYPSMQEEARLLVKEQNRIGEAEVANTDHIHHAMALHPPDDDPVVMTATPWQFHVVSGMKAVQIPYANVEAVVQVARKYNVDYMLLPRSIMLRERPLLRDLYEERSWPEGIYILAQDDRSDQWKVFKFILDAESN